MILSAEYAVSDEHLKFGKEMFYIHQSQFPFNRERDLTETSANPVFYRILNNLQRTVPVVYILPPNILIVTFV